MSTVELHALDCVLAEVNVWRLSFQGDAGNTLPRSVMQPAIRVCSQHDVNGSGRSVQYTLEECWNFGTKLNTEHPFKT